MCEYKNIIFDFDGTLVDTQIDIKITLKSVISKIKGIQINDTSIKIGPPLDEMIRTLVPSATPPEVKEIVRAFRSDYQNCGFNHTICYVGIQDLLLNLKEHKSHLYIATNKPGYLTNQIIEKLELKYFNDVCTIDTLEGCTLSKKEMIALLIERNKLNPGITIHIGDSYNDVKAANDNSIASVGVGYGYESKEKILMAEPDFYFDTVTQVCDFFIIK